jgi:hypothetical protein
VKFQLKKVLCMGVAVGNLSMEGRQSKETSQSWGLEFQLQQQLL